MKRPSRTKIVGLLYILQVATARLSKSSGVKWAKNAKLVDMWSYIAPVTSQVWIPMVEIWINAGVAGKHVTYAITVSSTSLNQLIENPEAFETSCVLRGLNVPHIEYPYSLDEGPAWEAVQKAQRKWHKLLCGVANPVGRVYCDLGSHPN